MGLFDDLPKDGPVAAPFADVPQDTPAPTPSPAPQAQPSGSLFGDLPKAAFKLQDGKILMDPARPADALQDLHAAGWISNDELERRLPDAQALQSAPKTPTTADVMSREPSLPPRWTPLQPREFDSNEPPMRIEAGQVFLDPTRYPAALKNALAAGVISPEDYDNRMHSAYLVQQAAQTERTLRQQAGPDAMANATIAGLGRGLVTLGAGAATGSAVAATAPESAFTSLALVPAASVAAGSTAGEVYDAILPQSMQAARQLHPLAYTSGDLATMVIPAPFGLAKALQAAKLVQETKGAMAATAFLAKPAVAGVAGAAGAQALDKLSDPDAKMSPMGLVLGGALGVAMSGLGLKSKNYSSDQLAEIWTRGANAAAQGLDPRDVLRPAEREVFDAMKDKFQGVLQSGQTLDPAQFDVSAEQMVGKGRGKAGDTEVVGHEKGGEAPLGAVKVTLKGAKAPNGPTGLPTGEPGAEAGTPPPTEPPSDSQEQFESQLVTQDSVKRGAPTVVIGAKGEEYPASYAWAPQAMIQPSHTGETLAANPDYPLTNTRDYGDQAEKDKALATRNSWDPRRAVTDSPDAAVGPPMVARVINGDGNATLAVVGGNNRQWAMQNLSPDQRQATLDYSNTKASNFGLQPAPDADSQIVRYLGTFDFRKSGDQARLQSMVDALNPSPGMVQSTAKRAEVDAATVPIDQLANVNMDIAPQEAQGFVRQLISSGTVDRNRLAGTAASPSQSQDYVQRLLVNAAFQQPAIAEARGDSRAANGPMRGLIDAATPALISLRQKGANDIANAIARTFTTTLDVTKNQGVDKLPQALDTVAAQSELDPAHAPAQAVAAALRGAVVTDSAGRLQTEPTLENARETFARVNRAVQQHQDAPDLFGEKRSIMDTLQSALQPGSALFSDLPKEPEVVKEEPEDEGEEWFHGSPLTFQRFEHTQKSDYGYFGNGVYLTNRQWRAQTYAGKGGNVYRVRVSARKFAGREEWNAAWKLAGEILGDRVLIPKGWTAKLKQEMAGYPDTSKTIKVWQVFDENGNMVNRSAVGDDEDAAINYSAPRRPPGMSVSEWDQEKLRERSRLATQILQQQGWEGVRVSWQTPPNSEAVVFDLNHVQIAHRMVVEETEDEYKQAADRVIASKTVTPAQTPTAEQRSKIIEAYQRQVKDFGFPAVRIADVLEAAGFPLDHQSKALVMGMYHAGDIVALATGDWSLSSDRVRAWGVIARQGESPALMMRMNASLQPGSTPGADAAYLDTKQVTNPDKQTDFVARQRNLDNLTAHGQLDLPLGNTGSGVSTGRGGSVSAPGGSGGGSEATGYYLPTSGQASAGASTAKQRAEVLRKIAAGTAKPEEIRKAFTEGQTISSIAANLVQEPQLGVSLRGAKVATAEDVARLFQGILRNPYKEVLRVLKLNNGQIEASEILHVGALNESVASAQEIIRFMQRSSGIGKDVIISHNHPSGDPTPSAADHKITNLIQDALKQAGYNMTDHVITNHGRYFSLRRGGEGTFAAEPAPWEMVSRNELLKTGSNRDLRQLVQTLRTGDPDAVHVAYLTTKLTLTAIERQPANLTLAQLAGALRNSAAREGAYGIAVSFPQDAKPLDILSQLTALKDLLSGGPRVIDGSWPSLPSAAAAGFLEKHARYVVDAATDRQSLREEPEGYSPVQAVDDKGNPYASVPLKGLNDIKIVQMPELVQLARELMGQLPELKRMSKARGQFAALGNGRIRLDPRIFSDPVSAAKTLGHEIGHLVGWLPDKVMKRGNLHGWISSLTKYAKDRFGAAAISNNDMRAELIGLSKYWKPYDPATDPKGYVQYRESAAELYADALSVLFNSPATLKQMAPKFYREFFRGLDTKPEVKTQFFEMQKWLSRPAMQILKDRATKADEMFAKAQDIFETKWKEREERYKGFSGWLSMLKQAFFDNFSPLLDREDAAGTGRVNDAARFLFDEHPLADNQLYRWLERMQRTVIEPAQASGFSMDDIGRQLFFKRIANESYPISGRIAEQLGMTTGGRSVIANPQGHTPQTARLQLLSERLENGVRAQTLLDSAVQRFHDLVYDVMKDAHQEGMFTNEQMALIGHNRDNYATFTPLEYVDIFLPAGLQGQAGTLKEIQNPFVSTVSKVLTLMRATQHQRLKATTVRILQRDWPAEIQRAETVRDGNGRETPRQPREKGVEQIMVREAGKPAWYNVPKEIAYMFDRPDIPLLDAALSILNTPFRKFFHPLFIEFNPVFQFFRHPMRNVRRNFVNAPVGVGFWDIARQMPLIKSIGPNPVLDAARDFVKRGKQQPLIAEMLDNLAITPGDAMFDVTPARPSTSFDRLLQKVKVLPEEGGHETWIEKIVPNFVAKVLKSVQMAGRINEIVPKASIYKVLRERLGWSPQEAAYYVRNFIGTPNYNKRGKHISLVNPVFPFVNIWMRGWQADMQLALKGFQRTDQPGKRATSPAAWWFRWAMTNGVWTVLKVAGSIGLLGAAIKKLYDGISDHYKANYDVIPLGTTGQGDYGPKVVFIPIPKDPVDRIISGIFYNALKTEGTLAAQHGLLGTELQQMNPPDGTGVGTMLQHNLAEIDSDVPGLNPMIKMASGWKTYLQGQNPLDDFRGKFVLSDAQFLAGGWDGVKPMLTWTYGQTGMSNFVSFDPQTGMTTEQLKNLPMINGMVKITDAGYHEQQVAAMTLEQQAAARLKLDMPANAQRLAMEYGTLQRLGDKFRTDEQTTRFQELKAWYQSIYRPAEQYLRDGKDNGMTASERDATLAGVKQASEQFVRK